MNYIIIAIISYVIGNISGSFLLGKLSLNIDIRNYGSGNAGTTNAFRVMGKKLGILTFVIDFLKGVLCGYLILKFFGKEYIPFSILFCVIGHDYPVFMKFKGGKGVATTLGSLAFFNFPLTLIPYFCWVIGTFFTKFVSVGSILFFVASGIVFSTMAHLSMLNIVLINAVCLLGIYRHHSNIRRLIQGTESKIGGKNESSNIGRR